MLISNAYAQTAAVAVSYTHLRAHETVLDLVCRLLLETKNEPQSKHGVHLYDSTSITLSY